MWTALQHNSPDHPAFVVQLWLNQALPRHLLAGSLDRAWLSGLVICLCILLMFGERPQSTQQIRTAIHQNGPTHLGLW